MQGDDVGERHIACQRLQGSDLIDQRPDHASLAGHAVIVRAAGAGAHVGERGQAVQAVVARPDIDGDVATALHDGRDPVLDGLADLHLYAAEQVDDLHESDHVDHHVVLDVEAGQLGQRRLDGLARLVLDAGEGIGVLQSQAVDLVGDARVAVGPAVGGRSPFREGDMRPVAGHVECGGVAGGHIDRQDDDRVGSHTAAPVPAVAAEQGYREPVRAGPSRGPDRRRRCGACLGRRIRGSGRLGGDGVRRAGRGGGGVGGVRCAGRLGGVGVSGTGRRGGGMRWPGRRGGIWSTGLRGGGGNRGRSGGLRVDGDEHLRQQGQLSRGEPHHNQMGRGDEQGQQQQRRQCSQPAQGAAGPRRAASRRGCEGVGRHRPAEDQSKCRGDHQGQNRRPGHGPGEQGPRTASQEVCEPACGDGQSGGGEQQPTAVPVTHVSQTGPYRGERRSHQRMGSAPWPAFPHSQTSSGSAAAMAGIAFPATGSLTGDSPRRAGERRSSGRRRDGSSAAPLRNVQCREPPPVLCPSLPGGCLAKLADRPLALRLV